MDNSISPEQEKIFHQAFFATVLLNGLIAITDIFAGLFFIFERPIASFLYVHHYPLAHVIQATVMELTSQSQLMGILYFLSHGIVKIFLVWGLLTNRLWAYPLSIVFLTGFSIYQIFTLVGHFSWFTSLLLFVNVITVFFIAREYRSL
jgi:uncharacterized membrane protein